MFKKMENPGYQRDLEKAVELKETNATQKLNPGGKKSSNGATVDVAVTGPSTSCTPEVCRTARQRYSHPELSGSPWHKKKTIFLVTFLVLLGVWIVVYTTLSQLKVL